MKKGSILLAKNVSSSLDSVEAVIATKIAGISCSLHFPGIKVRHANGKDIRLSTEPPGEGWPDHDFWAIPGLDGWHVKSLGISVDESISREGRLSIEATLGRWEQGLMDWLSCLAQGTIGFISGNTAEVIWQDYVPPGTSGYMYTGRNLTLNDPKCVTLKQWEHAIAAIEQHIEAPLGRVIFAGAIKALEGAQWRTAVVDAATTVEVALTNALQEKMTTDGNQTIADAVLVRVRTLGNLVDLARDLGLELPNNIKKDLIEVRNKVVHKGIATSQEMAQSACDIARALIDKYAPLA